MQRSTASIRRMRIRTIAWVAILGGLLESTSPAQPVDPEKVPTRPAARYRVTLQTPQTIFQGQDTAIVVRVQSGRGLPVDGVLVMFQVDAPQTRYTSIRPTRAHTRGGRVRAIVRSELLGRVRITVRVGSLIKRTTLTVVMPIAMGDTPRDAYPHARKHLPCSWAATT